MSWVRLDDQIAHHPKVTKCSPTACWLWVTAIGFSQKFLTDGFIPATSIPALSHVKHPGFYIRELVKAKLLDIVDGGYQIHDYLDWNQAATHIKQRREVDRVRKESSRIPRGQTTESARIPQNVLARAPASNPIPSLPSNLKHIGNQEEGRTKKPTPPPNGNGNGDARSKRPMFTGQRLTVFEWMTDDHMKILGAHAEAFDLSAWYWALDERMLADGTIQPKRDGGAWLEAELVAEAQRRKIPIKFAKAPDAKMTEDEKWREVARLGPMKRPHQS